MGSYSCVTTTTTNTSTITSTTVESWIGDVEMMKCEKSELPEKPCNEQQQQQQLQQQQQQLQQQQQQLQQQQEEETAPKKKLDSIHEVVNKYQQYQ